MFKMKTIVTMRANAVGFQWFHRLHGWAFCSKRAVKKFSQKEWRIKSKLHRLDGPAYIVPFEGVGAVHKEYWIKGKKVK